MKALGYILIIIGALWFIGVLGQDFLAVRSQEQAMGTALIHAALVGLIPGLIGIGAGGGILVWKQREDQENAAFDREQQLIQLINKEGRLKFDTTMRELGLNSEELMDLLSSMGRKRLITGILSKRKREFISGETMERKLSHGECPICNSLTAAEGPHVAVCTRCEAMIFLSTPSKVG